MNWKYMVDDVLVEKYNCTKYGSTNSSVHALLVLPFLLILTFFFSFFSIIRPLFLLHSHMIEFCKVTIKKTIMGGFFIEKY